ncbi:MAG: hypothetical protein Q8942_03095 [Bacillota bacterium]|nr:hypothetical protein [Bacillota bacterium]
MYSILLIGSDDYGTYLKKELRRSRYRLFFSSMSKPGLDKARFKRPDILIINTVSQGSFIIFDLIKEIKSDLRLKDAIIMILSENEDDVDKTLALELGADAYMVKPVNIDEMLFKLKCFLRNKKELS